MIDALAASVLGTDGVEVKPVLGAGLALDEEEPAVGAQKGVPKYWSSFSSKSAQVTEEVSTSAMPMRTFGLLSPHFG